MKKFLMFFLVAICVFGQTALCHEMVRHDRGMNVNNPSAEQIRLRHIEPKGLGYTDGYTSLDLFLTIPNMKGRHLPFVDLRGHLFNNGKYAVNLGVGLRFLEKRFNRVIGVNCFYDYRLTSRQAYNQGAVGLESLGEVWDFRANGYFALGAKEAAPFDFFYDLSTFLLTANRQTSMSGFDLMLGYRISRLKHFLIYVAPGLFYYCSNNIHEKTIGSSLRGEITMYKYLTLEAGGSYDPFFRWLGQIAVSINIPLGFRTRSRDFPVGLNMALLSPVQHNEVIVVGQKRMKL